MLHPLQHHGFLQPEEWIREFGGPENLNKPFTRSEMFHVADVSLLKEFCRNDYAHVIKTAEAYSLPTDAKQSFENYGLVGCHSSKSNDLSVHAGIDSTGYIRLLWESNEYNDKRTHAAIFKVRFGSKAKDFSQICESEQLMRFTMTWSLLHWPLKVQIPMSVRTALCLRQKVFKTPREGNWWKDQVFKDNDVAWCHLHHKHAMIAPAIVWQVLLDSTSTNTPLQGWCHCWRCQCGSIHTLQEASVPRPVQPPSGRHVGRDAARGQYGMPVWKQTSYWLQKQ